MKKIIFTFLLVFAPVQPDFADQQFYIEVLQVSNIDLFDMAYSGFLEELAKQVSRLFSARLPTRLSWDASHRKFQMSASPGPPCILIPLPC